MELTYYDIRPPDASVLNKRNPSEDPFNSTARRTGNKLRSTNESKHFGPREIKRRPLPPDPTGQTPPRPILPEIHSSPIPQTQTFDLHDTHLDQWAPDLNVHAFTNPSTPNHPNEHLDESKSPYDFELPRERVPLQTSPNVDATQRPHHRSYDNYENPDTPGSGGYSHQDDQNSFYQSQDESLFRTPGYDDRRHSAQPTFPSQNKQQIPSSSPYGSSPPGSSPFRPAPSSGDLRKRAQFNRFSTSPTKNEMFSASPLKQSMSHNDFGSAYEEAKELDDDDAHPPPPPPAHRNSSHQESQAVQMPEPLNFTPTPDRIFPKFQSPLQTIERAYDPMQANTTSVSPNLDRNGGYIAYSKPSYVPTPSRPRGNSQNISPGIQNVPKGLRTGYQPTVTDVALDPDLPNNRAGPPQFAELSDEHVSSSPQMNRPSPMSREDETYEITDHPAHRTPDRNLPFNFGPSAGMSREQEIRGIYPSANQSRDREVYGNVRSQTTQNRESEIYGTGPSPTGQDYASYSPSHRRPISSQGPSPYGSFPQRSPIDRQDPFHPQQSFRNGAPLYKPRAVSPDDRNRASVPSRKSISPSPVPTPSSESRSLSGIPFSPDSFDILNPSSMSNSSVGDGPEKPRYETPEQAREAARLREVEKMREVGPIIGNDGREIDPSDHLPSDTWAPEPERKSKKPEVVIRFKTGNRAGNSSTDPPQPNSTRPSPASAPRPQSMYANTPSPLDPGLPRGRNRLQKQNGPAAVTRPLPTQPFPHTQSSPAVPSSTSTLPYHTPSPRHPNRNSVSDYSVPLRENVNYNPTYGSAPPSSGYKGSPYGPTGTGQPPPRPAKIPIRPWEAGPDMERGYGSAAGRGGMDALSRELSSIDIGVGRRGAGAGRAEMGMAMGTRQRSGY